MLHKNQQPSANAKPQRPAAKTRPHSEGRNQRASAAPPPVQPAKEQKRPAQQAPPLRAKRQARLPPLREALYPVAPAVPSPAVVQQNTLRLAPDAKRGSLLFQGEMRFARSSVEAKKLVTELLRLADSSAQPVIAGFDSETPVVWGWQDGKMVTLQKPVALLQLSYHPPSSAWPICLLLQLSALGFSGMRLVELLEHPNIIKVGMGVACDMNDLQRDYTEAAKCQPQGLLDLDLWAGACGVTKPPSPKVRSAEGAKAARGIKTFNRREPWGLAGLLQHTTGYSLVKTRKVTQSDWSKQPLSRVQVDYAAADAFASLACCMALQVNWLQQQQKKKKKQSPAGLPLDRQGQPQQQRQQQQQQALVSDPKQMALWELSKGGGNKVLSQSTRDDSQQRWQQLLTRCCRVSARQLEQMQLNASHKADLLDQTLDWQLGCCYDSGLLDTPY